MTELPCDSYGMCMICKKVPLDENVLLCSSCASPWHMQCLKEPLNRVPLGDWDCPDCKVPAALPTSSCQTLIPQLSSASMKNDGVGKAELDTENRGKSKETLEEGEGNLTCVVCMDLAERPVTMPCGHNFCLICLKKWIGGGSRSCGRCQALIPTKLANHPRINTDLVMAIRLAKAESHGHPKPCQHLENEKGPDECFSSEPPVETCKENVCSDPIFVTIPRDHFGPIQIEHDPIRRQGVLVGECWADRIDCRQWGAHFPSIASIAGQSCNGAQSVVLSGDYEEDEDYGEWFLFTGSGGKVRTSNKRRKEKQSFDQRFEKSNEALRVSCERGYPVRVVWSHKEYRSAYAPERGVRYDGIYRIEKCWRKTGNHGHKLCRYLFVRCDNEPAPWTSNEHGDRPRPLPSAQELNEATDVFDRKFQASWDWKEESGVWGWTKDAPVSQKTGSGEESGKADDDDEDGEEQCESEIKRCPLCEW